MHIGDQIKRARMMKGLTQQQLADKIHKTRPLISSIEQTGKVNIYTLKQICEVLGIDIEALSMSTGELAAIYSPNKELEAKQKEIDSLRQQLAECQKQLTDCQAKIIEMLEKRPPSKGRGKK